MKSTIDIFTAGCPLCDPVIKLVKETATDNCEIVIYDLVKQCAEKSCINKCGSGTGCPGKGLYQN
jgi:hypothetical protein